MQLLPVGVPGELYVGGVSLARGYLHRPGLTAERFVPDPYAQHPGARLYGTGDLVRYLPDGNIQFLGRVDHQVKVRGFRIELGEIEAVLSRHPNVQEAVVLARDDVAGDRRLVAYAVSDGSSAAAASPPSVSELRSFLRQALPDYMVPLAFVHLDEWPLSPSGKIDRARLPAPDGDRPDLGREYVSPRTPTEAKLAEICAELLGIDAVGVHDSFFELGGHSLLATRFSSRIKDELRVEVPLRILFERPTVADLAGYVKEVEAEQSDMATIAGFLDQVSELSDDEVLALLGERSMPAGRSTDNG
jgi:acyl carrier protein